MESKCCAHCGSPSNGFTKDRRATDGLNSWCKLCTRKASKKWHRNNREHKAAVAKKWRERNPEKQKALLLKWVKENPERAREIGRNWRKRHPQTGAAWRAANPEKVLSYFSVMPSVILRRCGSRRILDEPARRPWAALTPLRIFTT